MDQSEQPFVGPGGYSPPGPQPSPQPHDGFDNQQPAQPQPTGPAGPPWQTWQPPGSPYPYPYGPRGGASTRRQPDSGYEYDDEDEPQFGCMPVVVGGFLFLVFAAVIVVVTIFAMKYFTGGTKPDDDRRPDRSVALLVDELKEIFTDKESRGHALYLSKVCRGVAGRLTDDYSRRDVIYDRSSEVMTLTGIVGEFATVVKGVNTYRGLDTVIESELRQALNGVPTDEKDDDQFQDVELTKEQRDAVVNKWNRLADAFAEVAGG